MNHENVTVPVGVAAGPTGHGRLVVHRRPRRHRRHRSVRRVVDHRHRARRDRGHRPTARRVPSSRSYVPSPEYDARNAKLPDTAGVCGNVVASATPGVERERARRRRRGSPAQVPLVNQRTSPSPSASRRPARSPSPGRAPSSPPAPTSPSRAPRRGSPSPCSTRSASPSTAHTAPSRRRTCRHPSTTPGTRNSRHGERRLRERRPVRDTSGVQRERVRRRGRRCARRCRW